MAASFLPAIIKEDVNLTGSFIALVLATPHRYQPPLAPGGTFAQLTLSYLANEVPDFNGCEFLCLTVGARYTGHAASAPTGSGYAKDRQKPV